MANQGKLGVLLLAHGSPDKVSDIPEFLLQVTGGRPLPPNIVHEVQHRYSLIGRSPLTEITLKQAADLQRELNLPVYVGMRNWHPFTADAVAKMVTDGIQRAIVICLAPQNSRTSVGLYRRALESKGALPFAIDFVESWHDHPLLIRAFAEKLKAGHDRACREAGTKIPVIFTAHSVPQRTITEGDPYEAQAKETAAMVAMETPSLSIDDWRFAFQSQGMSGGAWLGPTVEDTILDLQRQGHRGIFIQPIGFLCDHVEVLYDVDIAFKQFAEKQGLRLWRAESLNDSPLLIAALADVVRSRIAPAEENPSLVKIKTVQ
ncbi:MAG TPA: ferrochelatase [Terriglobales bacterium]|nr:ferrochelatase [Terriglobales bacterium]